MTRYEATRVSSLSISDQLLLRQCLKDRGERRRCCLRCGLSCHDQTVEPVAVGSSLRQVTRQTRQDPNSRRQQSYSDTSKLNQAAELDPAAWTDRISTEVPLGLKVRFEQLKVDYGAEHGRSVSLTDLYRIAWRNGLPSVEEIDEALDLEN